MNKKYYRIELKNTHYIVKGFRNHAEASNWCETNEAKLIKCITEPSEKLRNKIWYEVSLILKGQDGNIPDDLLNKYDTVAYVVKQAKANNITFDLAQSLIMNQSLYQYDLLNK